MLRFSIIIVSWNALHHLKKFLPSVIQTDYEKAEIILADNASTDGSKAWVKKTFPGVRIVTFDQNYGYCGGNNRAIAYATGDILVFLNNDVKVESDWISPLSNLFKSCSDVAAAQPKIRSYKDPDAFEYAGAAGGHLDRYGYPFCRGRIFDAVEKDHAQYDNASDIFWASGAALAIRKSAFEQLGGFDEDFEFHMEEIDLCWRLWNQGKRVAYCPQSVVYHLGGGSLSSDSPRKLYYNYRNSLRMLWKNYDSNSLNRLLVRAAFDLTALMRELYTGRISNVKAIFKGYYHFLCSFNRTRAKRKALQARRKQISNPAVMKRYSIIWQYFINRITKYASLPEAE